MNREQMCMNHPDVLADPAVSEWGPPLCPECTQSAELPDGPETPDLEAEAAYWEHVASVQAAKLRELAARAVCACGGVVSVPEPRDPNALVKVGRR